MTCLYLILFVCVCVSPLSLSVSICFFNFFCWFVCLIIGPIKEVRHTPWKKNQRFLEFFDIRDAAMALKQMNGKEIRGKPVVIEFSKPGGHGRRYFHSTYSPIPKKPINLNVPPPSPPPFYHSQRRRFAPRFHSPQPQVSPKRRGSPNSGSLASSMGSMSLIKVEHSHGTPRRNFRRSQSRESTVGTPKQYHYQQVTRSRQWKGKQTNNRETRFLIKEDAIVESSFRDPRTTVMIKNIPNKYRSVFCFLLLFLLLLMFNKPMLCCLIFPPVTI